MIPRFIKRLFGIKPKQPQVIHNIKYPVGLPSLDRRLAATRFER